MPIYANITKPVTPKFYDTSNSLTTGLVFDMQFYEGNGSSSTELVSAQNGTFTNSPVWEASNPYSFDLSFNGAASAGPIIASTTGTTVNTQSLMSFEGYLLSSGSGGGTNGRFMHKKQGATRWKIQMAASATVMEFDIDCTSTFPAWHWTITSGVWFHFVLTYDDTNNANVPIVYINGTSVSVTTDVAKTEARIADDTNLYIGNYDPAVGAKTWNGKIAYARIWNRILTSTEAGLLYSNPWRIYARPRGFTTLRPRPFAPGIAR